MKFIPKTRAIFEYILLAIIILGAFVVRLYKIDSPIADWHSWRQADTASVSRLYAERGIDLLHPQYHDISSVPTGYNNPRGWRFVEFPLYNAIHAIVYNSYPSWSLERWGRIISVIFSLVSVLMMYLVGRRFLGPSGGLLSAAFFAFLPFNIYFSRVILPEPFALSTALISLWFFVLWIDNNRFWQLFFSSLFFTLALLLKPYTIFLGIPMVYLVWEKFRFRTFFYPRLWIFISLALMPLFVWRAFMNNFLEGIPHWLWAFNGDEIRFKPAWWWWIFDQRIGQLMLGGFALVPFALGFLYRSKIFPFFVQSVFAGQFLYFSLIATANVRHDYYQTFAVPSVAFLLAGGTLFLWNIKVGEILVRRLLVLAVVCAGLVFSFYQVREFYKINHPEIITAGSAADRILPKDALVIAPYNGDTAFLYQTKRQGWPHVTLPMGEMIERLGAQYYVSVNFDLQTKEVMEQYKVLEKTDQYVIVKLK